MLIRFLFFRGEAVKKAEEKKINSESRSLKEINNAAPSSSIEPVKKNNRKRKSNISEYIDHQVNK